MNKLHLVFKSIVAIVFLLLSNANINAQNQAFDYTIVGTVLDSTTKNPLSFATISLLDDKNTPLKISISNENGAFIFSNVAPLKYTIAISAMGYAAKKKAFEVLENAEKTLNIGTIYCSASSNELQEVTIVSQQPIIQRGIDRIAYNVQQDPESKVLSTLEMMKKVPYLSVDGENNILLKGNGSYKIFINGKPSGMVENNPKEFLKNLPAATIQKIEVITNPPSKYDAEGLAGIINILLNKKVKDGFTGSINLNQGFPTAGTGIGTSFSMKKKKLGVTVYGGGNQNQTPKTIIETSQQSNLIGLFQKGTKENDNKSAYLGTEISYEIDTLNLLTTQLNSYGSKSNGDNFQNTVLNNTAVLFQSYDAKNTNKGAGFGLDAAINYELGFKKDKKRLLTFSARHSQYENNQHNTIAFSNPFNYAEPNYKQENIGKNTEQTFQIDYVRPIKSVRMELGVKGIFRKNTSDFAYLSFNNTNGLFEKDAKRSDEFDNSQNIFSFYNSYQFNVKSWNFQTGFRIEETQIKADFVSSATKVAENYFNIVPSVAIQKGFENESSIQIGFNQRIKRPGINRLNPFIDRSNPNFITTGNPSLRPVANNDIQLGYSIAKKVSIDVSLGYSFSKNIDLKVSSFDATNNITFTTYENTGKASRLGLDFNANYAPIKNLKLSLNGNVAYFDIEGFEGKNFIENNVFTYYLAFSSGYSLKNGWKINASANFIGENPTGLQGVSNALVSSSFSCNKELIKEKLYLSAYINNPFTKFRDNRTELSGSNFIQMTNNQEFFRTFGFSLNYQFGRLGNEIKKNKRAINNNDVSN
ncbi:MAG: hypothetical protein RLZZ292_1161 [Bacteroidota bacterium]|jgi:outer membrane receptor protein involved in Fe transport